VDDEHLLPAVPKPKAPRNSGCVVRGAELQLATQDGERAAEAYIRCTPYPKVSSSYRPQAIKKKKREMP
jgi:hypothetical protein